MRCNEIYDQDIRNIREGICDDFLHASVNLSDRLGIKDYTYIVINDGKVIYVSSYVLHIS